MRTTFSEILMWLVMLIPPALCMLGSEYLAKRGRQTNNNWYFTWSQLLTVLAAVCIVFGFIIYAIAHSGD